MGDQTKTVLLGTEHDEMIVCLPVEMLLCAIIKHDIQMDFHGQLIATCSSDQTVKIFAPQGSGQPYQHVQTLKGHDGPVWAVGWAHPKFGGSHLASCSYDHKSIIIWKEAAHHHWSKHYEHKKHNGSVNALSWGPHELGLCLAAASSDGTVSILYKGDEQWSDYSIDAHPGGCNAVSWAPYLPAGSILTLAAGKSGAASSRRIVSAGCDHKVKIWKFTDKAGSLAASTWELEATLQEHTDWVRDVQWAGNIGLPVSYIASCGQDGKVVVWTQKAEGDTWEGEVILQGDDPQWHVSWSELGNLLAVSGSNNQASLWRQMPNGAWKRVSNLAPADPQ